MIGMIASLVLLEILQVNSDMDLASGIIELMMKIRLDSEYFVENTTTKTLIFSGQNWKF